MDDIYLSRAILSGNVYIMKGKLKNNTLYLKRKSSITTIGKKIYQRKWSYVVIKDGIHIPHPTVSPSGEDL
jgi:hypothetical protein